MGFGIKIILGKMTLSDNQRSLIEARITVIVREVGTLLLAFAPLDDSLQINIEPWSLVGFVTAGGGLFVLSLVREIRSGQ